MSPKTYSRVERSIIVLMLVGIAAMFQPFTISLYRYGFLVLLFSTITFIIVSHLSPKFDSSDAPGAVSLGQVVERT